MPVDQGNQTISLKFGVPGNSSEINERFLNIRKTGIYKGGSLEVVDSSHIRITPLVCEITDGSYQVRVETTINVTLSITSATPYVILRWSYTGDTLDYMELLAVASGSILSTDLIVGKGSFVGSTLNGYSYSERSLPEVIDRFLEIVPTEDTELKVLIRSGRLQNGSQTIVIPEQKSSLFTAPISNSRIDLLIVNTITGAIEIVQGTAGASPSAPSYAGRLVLAEITLTSTSTDITESMISDVRGFLTPYPPDGDGIYIETDVDGNYTLKNYSIDSTKISRYLPSQIFPGWYMKYHATNNLTSPSQFTYGDAQGRLISLGQIIHSHYSGSTGSFLFEMQIYNNSGAVKSVLQKLRFVDDNAYFYLNSVLVNSSLGAGSKNTDITWNLISGANTLQIVLNNSGGGGSPMVLLLLGDIINSSDVYFVGAV